MRRWFPVRGDPPYAGIGFSAVAAFRSNFESDHGLTLEKLADQGGLDWIALWCGFTATALFPSPRIDVRTARTQVLDEVMRRATPDGIARIGIADQEPG